MHDFQTINLEIKDNLAYLTLNRPQVRNALNHIMIKELLDAAVFLDSQPVSIVVIRGAGTCFCSGVDIYEKATYTQKSKESQSQDTEKFLDVFFRIASMKSIVIGVAHGHVVGGGVGLLAACDVVLAHPETKFSITATKIGILPAAMSTVLVQALGIRWAKFLSLTGQMIDCDLALVSGLIQVIGKPDINETLSEVLNLFADGDQVAILETKRLYNSFQYDHHSSSRSERLSLIQKFTATNSAQERFEKFKKEGVFWHRK